MIRIVKLLLAACVSVCGIWMISSCKPSGGSNAGAVNEVKKTELFRTSHSWDGAELPDYPEGKPELVCMRYVFPVGQKLEWHHHPVMNFGIMEQGELTIIGLDGTEKVIRAGETVVEMVGTIHRGENRGSEPVILNMFYLSQEGLPLSVQHPEIPME
jgi:quercetin dioxygenase-like cupin family protein